MSPSVHRGGIDPAPIGTNFVLRERAGGEQCDEHYCRSSSVAFASHTPLPTAELDALKRSVAESAHRRNYQIARGPNPGRATVVGKAVYMRSSSA